MVLARVLGGMLALLVGIALLVVTIGQATGPPVAGAPGAGGQDVEHDPPGLPHLVP
jgi:hypothetical protein